MIQMDLPVLVDVDLQEIVRNTIEIAAINRLNFVGLKTMRFPTETRRSSAQSLPYADAIFYQFFYLKLYYNVV
jgi:hypothetical protein